MQLALDGDKLIFSWCMTLTSLTLVSSCMYNEDQWRVSTVHLWWSPLYWLHYAIVTMDDMSQDALRVPGPYLERVVSPSLSPTPTPHKSGAVWNEITKIKTKKIWSFYIPTLCFRFKLRKCCSGLIFKNPILKKGIGTFIIRWLDYMFWSFSFLWLNPGFLL